MIFLFNFVKNSDFKNLDSHFRPQNLYRETIKFDYIIKIENKGLNKLNELFNYHYDFSIPAYDFRSKYTNKNIDQNNYDKLKASELNKLEFINKNLLLTR